RRRHTRCLSDWSSDVCSSDLIDSSSFPIHRGVYWTTLVGVICTCVGKRWLPLLRRLARKTSPGANGRPLRHTINKNTATTAARRSEERRVGKEWESRRPREHA